MCPTIESLFMWTQLKGWVMFCKHLHYHFCLFIIGRWEPLVYVCVCACVCVCMCVCNMCIMCVSYTACKKKGERQEVNRRRGEEGGQEGEEGEEGQEGKEGEEAEGGGGGNRQKLQYFESLSQTPKCTYLYAALATLKNLVLPRLQREHKDTVIRESTARSIASILVLCLAHHTTTNITIHSFILVLLISL